MVLAFGERDSESVTKKRKLKTFNQKEEKSYVKNRHHWSGFYG